MNKGVKNLILPAVIAGATEGFIQSFAAKLPLVGGFGVDASEAVLGYVLSRYVLKKGMGHKVAQMYMALGIARFGARMGGPLLGGLTGSTATTGGNGSFR